MFISERNPLRIRRQIAGLSRNELARRSGMSFNTLKIVESAMVRRITEKTASRIAPFLGADADTLRAEYAAFRDSLLQEPEAA